MLCLLSPEQLHKADFSSPAVVVAAVFTLSCPLSMRITSPVVVVQVVEVCLNGVNQTFSSL